jgi:predicted subunit of tRNA(5-methylaminomethyl-2-thiouridylate) methyltransferase
MKAILLFSGGKDSSLVAHLLKTLNYDVKLVTANFGAVPDCWETAAEAAKILGFEHEVLEMNPEIILKAADMCEEDKKPRHAIDYVHRQVLEATAKKYPNHLIADGCRRDDVTPKIERNEAKSLEDRFGIEYFNPLGGISYKTINYLTESLFITENIRAGAKPTSEYETEIRAELRKRGGDALERGIFPDNHYHSIVLGWKHDQE